ncbi:hypothetical protein MSG28_004812 [Choristoneura fumiferana]|uniref:Uncharacterized protein n=1 Tax=Choristoneura fumiferana TaxID=7141 RepID=A0ACC0K7D3_CHOFU|nr:hypothetical protein MSG28_004812 [Choristoneura fumiferana]
MDYLKDFPLEFSKPFAICFDLLAKANISVHDQKRGIRRNIRSLLLVVCYVTFYVSLVVSFGKVFTGELGFYELANLLPIFIVATQGAMKGIVIITNLAKARILINELGAMWRTSGLTRNQVARKGMMLKKLNLCNAVLHLIYMYLGVEFLMITLCSHLATEFELLREELLHARPTLETIGVWNCNDYTNDLQKDEMQNDVIEVEDEVRPDIKDVIRRHQKLIM